MLKPRRNERRRSYLTRRFFLDIILAARLVVISAGRPVVHSMAPANGIWYINVDLSFWLSGESLDSSGDAVRFISGNRCSAGSAAGTRDLDGSRGDFVALPNGELLTATSSLRFQSTGVFNVCIKYSGSLTFQLLDKERFSITIRGPSTLSPTWFRRGEAIRFTVAGLGLLQNSATGGDSVKVVTATAAKCAESIAAAQILDRGGPGDEADGTIDAIVSDSLGVGNYKLCYKPSGAPAYIMMSSLITIRGVSAMSTTKTSIGVILDIVFSGIGLSRAPTDGDSVKFVDESTSDLDCDSASASTRGVIKREAKVTGEVPEGMLSSDLLPDDSVNQKSTAIRVMFRRGGHYRVCYKLSGASFVMLPFTMRVKGPTSIGVPHGPLLIGAAHSISIKGIDLEASGDRIKFVEPSDDGTDGDCTRPPAGGTDAPAELTDLGPDKTTGTTTVTFTKFGHYQLCYKKKDVSTYVLQPNIFYVEMREL